MAADRKTKTTTIYFGGVGLIEVLYLSSEPAEELLPNSSLCSIKLYRLVEEEDDVLLLELTGDELQQRPMECLIKVLLVLDELALDQPAHEVRKTTRRTNPYSSLGKFTDFMDEWSKKQTFRKAAAQNNAGEPGISFGYGLSSAPLKVEEGED